MYAREVVGQALDFGVSGLLWNDNVLTYDRQSESLWSQVQRRAVGGPRTGARLLTTDTGHRRSLRPR